MAKVRVKTKILPNVTQIKFRYVYEKIVVPDPDQPDIEKSVTGAFFIKNGTSRNEIKKRIKRIIKEQLKIKQKSETTEEVDIDLET